MDRSEARDLLARCFAAALAAVDPEVAVAARLGSVVATGRVVVLALGKAAPAMARGAAAALGVEELAGIAVSSHVEQVPVGIDLIIGGHPVPNQGSLAAGTALLEVAASLGPEDVAVVLISGGGSALAEAPIPGVSIADIASTNEVLLRSGADIFQTNTVRRRLSLLKGGGLAAAIAPARLVTLVVSDVVGDIIEVIASGPTVGSTDSEEAALEVARRLDIEGMLPESVVTALRAPMPVVTQLPDQDIKIVAGGAAAAHAAAAEAERLGFPATVVDTRLTGEASQAAGEALSRSRASISVFACETTVNVVGEGVGGRNQEAALTVATLIEGRSDVFFLAAGTDGIDGTSSGAGAFVDGTTLPRARALGLSAADALECNDSGSFFAESGDQIVTGPTGTNVGDLWLILRTGTG